MAKSPPLYVGLDVHKASIERLSIWQERHQQIDVAVRPGLATQDRPEQRQSLNAKGTNLNL